MKDNTKKLEMEIMSDETIQIMVDGVNTKLKDIENKYTVKALNNIDSIMCIPINHYQNTEDGFQNIDFDMLQESFNEKMQQLEDDQDQRRDMWSEKQLDYANDSK